MSTRLDTNWLLFSLGLFYWLNTNTANGDPTGSKPATTSQFAPIIGVWNARMSTGQDRVYRINEDGTVSFKDVHGAKEGKLSIVDGKFAAEFDDRWTIFEKLSEDVLTIEMYNPKSRFATRSRSATGSACRDIVSQVVKPVAQPAAVKIESPVKPSPAASASVPVAQHEKTISLKRGWDTPMQGGNDTMKELSLLLNGFSTAQDKLTAPADHPLYEKVTYLMPLKDAVAALGLAQHPPSQNKVVCPGFPRDSFTYVSYDGMFEGSYNRMDIVVDSSNQVAAIQLVDERPKENSSTVLWMEGDWLTFNFVGYRVKAITHMKVKYDPQIRNDRSPEWFRKDRFANSQVARFPVLRLDSLLENKERRRMEQVRWYVPRPLGDLILHCVQRSTR